MITLERKAPFFPMISPVDFGDRRKLIQSIFRFFAYLIVTILR